MIVLYVEQDVNFTQHSLGKGTYRRVVKLLPLDLDISTRDISPPR